MKSQHSRTRRAPAHRAHPEAAPAPILPGTPTAPRRRRNGKALPALAAILLILGVSIFLYPSASQWINQKRQANVLAAYSEITETVNPPAPAQIEKAHEYNELLAGGGMVDIAGHVPTIREQSANIKTPEQHGIAPYEEQLLALSDGLMGRVRVPAADVDLPIYHGTTDFTLLKGAGHLQGTALPVGGIGTRSVVTAHRGLADQAMFTHLDRVKEGDEFTFEVLGEVFAYQVTHIQVVSPEDVESIRPDANRDLATLITCTPLGINTERIVITGERVLPTPEAALEALGQPSELPRFPWWAVWWLLAVVAAIGFYFFARPKNDDDADAPAEPAAPVVGEADAGGN